MEEAASSRHPPVRGVFSPLSACQNSDFIRLSWQPREEAASDTTGFFSASARREEPFMFPSASTAVYISSSHCQQLHPPHLSSLGLLPLRTLEHTDWG